MSQRSRGRDVLARVWLPLVAVIAVAVGALCMWKVHQASAPGPVLAVNGPQAPEEFVPKQLTYELDGDLGDGGLLSYMDIDGHPHTVNLDTLPWSHTETTTLTVVSGSISAQVHGGDEHNECDGQLCAPRAQKRQGGDDVVHTARHRDGHGHHIVDEQSGCDNQPGLLAEILVGDLVIASAGRVCLHQLPV